MLGGKRTATETFNHVSQLNQSINVYYCTAHKTIQYDKKIVKLFYLISAILLRHTYSLVIPSHVDYFIIVLKMILVQQNITDARTSLYSPTLSQYLPNWYKLQLVIETSTHTQCLYR